jgi:glycosyltransferase 2 family protein
VPGRRAVPAAEAGGEPAVPAAGPAGPAGAGRAGWPRRALRLGFLLLAAGLGGYAVARRWGEVRAGFGAVGPLAAGLALLAVLAGLLASVQVWRRLLAALGSPLPLPAAARVFFLAQLGKYVPGAMWPVLAQVELARAHRVPPRRAATVAVLTMLVSLCSGLLAALATLPVLAGGRAGGYAWAFLAVPALLAALHPRVVNPVLAGALRLARRPPLERALTFRALVGALTWSLLSWLLLGAHVWVLAVRLGAAPGRAALLGVGGFAFAWCAGFLVVFAPAGAGVREVLLVAALAPVLPVAAATVVALASRLLMTLADLIMAGLAAAPRGARR